MRTQPVTVVLTTLLLAVGLTIAPFAGLAPGTQTATAQTDFTVGEEDSGTVAADGSVETLEVATNDSDSFVAQQYGGGAGAVTVNGNAPGTTLNITAQANEDPDQGLVRFLVNGEVATIENVTDGDGNSVPVVDNTFVEDDGDSGEKQIELAATADIPNFEVTLNEVTDPVVVGDNATVEYTVTNTGNASDTQDITFSINDTAVATDRFELAPDESVTETFTNVTTAEDTPALDLAVSSNQDTATRTITVEEQSGAVTFADQATNATTLTGTDRTTASVTLEDVTANVNSSVIVTYQNDADETVIAAGETFTATALNGSARTLPIEDAGGFPGAHTAHVIPTTTLANPSAGATVAPETAADATDTDTATVFQASVAVTDQQAVTNTSTVTINSSNLEPTSTDYVVVVHPLTGGTIGDPIGASGNLTGDATNTTVAVEEITTTGEFVGMLHFGSDTDEFGTAIPNSDAADGFVRGNVVDNATVDIQTAATGTLSNLTVAGTGANGTIVSGANTTVSADVTNTGDVNGTFETALTLNGTTVTNTVSVASGETTTTTFEPVTDGLDPGTFPVDVATPDDSVTGTLDVLEPAEANLTALDIAGNGSSANIVEGDAEAISVTAANDGEEVSNLTVTLDIEGVENESQTTAELSDGANQTVVFENATGGLESQPGAYAVVIRATTDTGSSTAVVDGTLTVRNAATTSLTNLTVAGSTDSPSIVEGDNETVTVNVTNTGDAAGSETVTLDIGTTVSETERIRDLGAGDTETVSFENVTGGLADGTSTVTVATDDDSAQTTLTVREPATAAFSALDIAGQGDDADVFTDDNESISVDLANDGEVNASFDVQFTITDSTGATALTETQSVTVNASEPTQTVETRNLTGELAADAYTVTVNSTNTAGNSASGDLRVREPVADGSTELDALDIAGQNATANVLAGTDDSVTVNVTNNGTSAGAVTVELTVTNTATDATTTNSTIVELDEGATETATFSNVSGDLAAGNYTVTASTPDDSVNGTLTVDEPATFTVSDLDPQETTKTAGQNFTVSATITNDGDRTGEQEIELRAEPTDDDPLATDPNVSLDAGENTTVEFNISIDTVGTFNHTVASADDRATGNLTVEAQPATFTVSDLDPQETTETAGQRFDVSATITNDGGQQGTQNIELRAEPNGTVLATESNVSLAGGDSTPVTFENVTVNEVGEFNHTVASANDSATGSLTVEAPSDPNQRALLIAGKDDPEEVTRDDVTSVITSRARGEQVNGVEVTRDDVTATITLRARN